MTLWTITPRDPLIFRDGKPFNAGFGARANSLSFPFPATIAGAVRTLAGSDSQTGKFDTSRIEEVRGYAIRGPLLVGSDEKKIEYLFPAPADALLLKVEKEQEKAHLLQLLPIALAENEKTDLKALKLVAPTEATKGKPHRMAPRFWREEIFINWLGKPKNGEVSIENIGHQGPISESRMHVQMDSSSGVGVDGALFQTSGLEFSHLETTGKSSRILLSRVKKLALAVETDAPIYEGMGFLGGERRTAEWQKTDSKLPKCPPEIKKEIARTGACRLVLLTPAYFEQGYLPTWLKENYVFDILSVALPRHQIISGWNYEKKAPKATRKLVPAGSVYFLKFEENAEKFAEEIWMQNISDGNQNRLDGFGLAVLGTWDGELKNLEVQNE